MTKFELVQKIQDDLPKKLGLREKVLLQMTLSESIDYYKITNIPHFMTYSMTILLLFCNHMGYDLDMKNMSIFMLAIIKLENHLNKMEKENTITIKHVI